MSSTASAIYLSVRNIIGGLGPLAVAQVRLGACWCRCTGANMHMCVAGACVLVSARALMFNARVLVASQGCACTGWCRSHHMHASVLMQWVAER